MFKLFVFVCVGCCCLTPDFSVKADSSSDTLDSKSFASAVTTFSAKFLNELDKDKSVVASPLSAEFLLALLTLGSTEPAHSELLTSLGIPDDDSIRSSFSSESSKLKSLKKANLTLANKVYLQEGNYELSSQFEEDAMEVCCTDIEKVDFSNSNVAASLINGWVEHKTNNKIKDLLSADSLDSDTRLVLVNALYFQGAWQSPFKSVNTIEQSFNLNANTSVEVPMMYTKDDFRYGESTELQAQILELPYRGAEMNMILILPNEIEGLGSILTKLAKGYDLISELDQYMISTTVQVSLPKFKIESENDLTELLPEIGIENIFIRGKSSLTKILNNSNETLFVSKAVQKAYIEVNEDGTEAAAATAIGIMGTSAIINVDPVQRFEADRPFLVIILVGDTPYFVATYRGDEE